MIVCALDVATTTGLAITKGDAVLHWEAFRPKGKTSAEIHSGFRKWLMGMLRAWSAPNVEEGIGIVVIEQPIPNSNIKSNMATIRRLYGLIEAAESVCFDLNVPSDEAHIISWRTGVYGKGTKPPKGTSDPSAWWKQQALQRCAMLKIPVKSKDAAEAICIAHWYAAKMRMQMISRLTRS